MDQDVWIIGSPGSGKSIAYAIGVLQKVDLKKNYTQALCLVSSIEAAMQLLSLMTDLASFTDIRIGMAVKSNAGKR